MTSDRQGVPQQQDQPQVQGPPRTGLHGLLVQVLGIALVAGAVCWILDVPRALGFALYTEQVLTFGLAVSLALVFLLYDWRGRYQHRLVWYDCGLALVGLAAAMYMTIYYPRLVNELVFQPLHGIILCSLLVGLTLEGVRRSAGMALAIVIGSFIIYGLYGYLLPGDLAGGRTSFAGLAVYLGADTGGILGIPLQVAVIVVVPFILLGRMLSDVGGSNFFTGLAMSMMGRYRGGSGKIAIVGSTLFGSVSGSAVANVAATGVVTIPLMKRSGFPPHLAAGVEAVASTGSQLMPPVIGATAFLMAEMLQIPYSEVMLAALVPILLYYVALFIQVDLLAARMGLKAVPRELIPDFWPTLREGWHFPLPFVVFLTLLLGYNAQAEVAAMWAVASLLVTVLAFGYKGVRPGLRQLIDSVAGAGTAAVEIVLICAGAGLVIGVLNVTGTAFDLSMQILKISGGNLWGLLLLAAAASVVLGMGMPTVGVYVLLATLIAPAMIEAGVTPMAAHMFVLYFGMLSMVTPPVALASFTASNIAGANPWWSSLAAVRLGWTAYIVPFLFVFSPALLLDGDWPGLVWAVATALVGVWLVSAAMAGQLYGAIGWLTRVPLAATGIMVLIPPTAFAGAWIVEMVGLVGSALLLLLRVLAVRVSVGRSAEA
ncbi:MAG: TRAP transporter fused permease subunit [Aquisalimonadaceae bacterium]